MEIATTSIQTATTATAATPKKTEKAAINADYNTFLKMLTAQLQNQDPLNPIESSDYAVQLATFSSVEQQTKTNDLLKGLSDQFGTFGLSQLAGWVGQEARVEAPVYMSGSAVALAPEPVTGADRAVLVVRNERGGLVAREDMPANAESYMWLGADAAGDPLPQGRYTLSVESYLDDTLMKTAAVQSYQRITEVRGGEGGTTLLLAGGVEVPSTAVTALRQPKS